MNIRRAVRLTPLVEPLAPSFRSVSRKPASWRKGRRTLSQSRCTSFSANCLQLIKLSIQPSKVGIDAGSVAGERRGGSGTLAISTSTIFESILQNVEVAEDRKSQHGKTMAQMVKIVDQVPVILEACVKKRPNFATPCKSFIEFLEHWGRVKFEMKQSSHTRRATRGCHSVA